MTCTLLFTEGLKNMKLGIRDSSVFYEAQEVTFECRLNNPCPEVKWLKDGVEITATSNPQKYSLENDNDIVHRMIMGDVSETDNGIYTFKVTSRAYGSNVSLKGQFY